MKLFKKVFILSVVVLSVGSSVAFGCNADQQFTSGNADQVKVGDSAAAATATTTTQSNGAESKKQ